MRIIVKAEILWCNHMAQSVQQFDRNGQIRERTRRVPSATALVRQGWREG